MPSYSRDQRTGQWLVRWSVTDPLTGKRSQPSKRPFRTKGDAERWYLANVAGKQIGVATTTPLADYLTQWLDAHQLRLSDRTRPTYRHAVNTASRFIGHVRLRDLTRAHIRAWHTAMVDEGYAPTTIKLYHAVIGNALNQAVDDGLIYTSPTARVSPPPRDRAVHPHWEPDEILHFLDATTPVDKRSDWKVFPLRIMALTALRPGECRQLRWSDLDLPRGTLAVPDAKSTAGVRTIAIPDALRRELRLWRPIQVESRLAAPYWVDHDLVTTSPVRHGYPLHATTLIQRLKSYCKALGLPRITPHGLRHSWASWMAAENVHPLIVQQVMGHANVSMTLDVYSHASASMSRQAAASVDSALNGPRVSDVSRDEYIP